MSSHEMNVYMDYSYTKESVPRRRQWRNTVLAFIVVIKDLGFVPAGALRQVDLVLYG